jgi:hypothetical protein
MNNLLRSPYVVFAVSFIAMWLAGWIGAIFRKKLAKPDDDMRQDLDLVVTANLTLLALIIGFSFSMAITRRPRPMQLAQNMSARACFLAPRRQKCVPF